jgi:hypothetical protein
MHNRCVVAELRKKVMILDTQQAWLAMWDSPQASIERLRLDREFEAEFYARHRRAVLTVAKFAGIELAFVNACLCWV